MCFQHAIPLQIMKAPSKRCSIRVSKNAIFFQMIWYPQPPKNQKQRSCSVTFVLACNVFLSLHLLVFLCVRSSRPALILLFLLSITSAMFVVLTICGHRHVPFPASTTKRPIWLYRGFTSYQQTEWLRNTLLVKRISCLVSQSGSTAMTLPEKGSADTHAEACLYLSPQRCYAKRT